MARHIACLRFDFEVWSGWTARGMKTPTPVSRGEFGLIGAKRILALLAEHGIRSTWCNVALPGLMNARDVLANWLDDFRYMTRVADWEVLTYTCHPYVIGRGHRMLMLERLIQGLKEMGAVFMSMEDAVDEFLARGARPADRSRADG